VGAFSLPAVQRKDARGREVLWSAAIYRRFVFGFVWQKKKQKRR
jgi:hypothetical protein